MTIKNTIKGILVAAMVFVCMPKINAQQVSLFSNYNVDRFMVNPASAGATGGMSAAFFHRSQWSGFEGAPNTQYVDFQTSVQNSNFSFGVSFMNDEAGAVRNINVELAPSYRIRLSGTNNLNIGFGLDYQSIDINGNLVDNADLSDGVLVDYIKGFGNFYVNPSIYFHNDKVQFGFSVPQLTENGISFGTNNSMLDFSRRHYLAVAGFNYDINREWSFNPSVMARFERAAPANYDVNANISYNDLLTINLGYRSSGMLITGVSINLGKMFDVGYSYDSNLDKTGFDNGSGSHEVFAQFKNDKGIKVGGKNTFEVRDVAPVQSKMETKVEKPMQRKVFGSTNVVRQQEAKVNDADGDGVKDEFDRCPNEKGKVGNFGCPYVMQDSDGDTVLDKFDLCPFNYGSILNKGCPE